MVDLEGAEVLAERWPPDLRVVMVELSQMGVPPVLIVEGRELVVEFFQMKA